jgi:hypothetical protein
MDDDENNDELLAHFLAIEMEDGVNVEKIIQCEKEIEEVFGVFGYGSVRDS